MNINNQYISMKENNIELRVVQCDGIIEGNERA